MFAYVAATHNPGDLSWYPNTGATNHIYDLQNIIIQANPYPGPNQVHIGNGQGLDIHHVGSAHLFGNRQLKLNNILNGPQFQKNLLLVHQFTCDNKWANSNARSK